VSEIQPGTRAALDRQLAEAVDGLMRQAARRDHLDVIEANADLAAWFHARMSHRQLAVTAAALAIRLHRAEVAG
jgi:hypothetical protein